MIMPAPPKYSYRRIAFIVVLVLGAFAIGFSKLSSFIALNSLHPSNLTIYDEEYDNSPISSDGVIDDTFKTHLPIVVIDIGGEEIEKKGTWNTETYVWDPADHDINEYGTMNIINKVGQLNNITDEPSFKSDILIRRRGNSSMVFEKGQYMVKLVDEKGTKKPRSVLGMGRDWEWILNISLTDSSLIRNSVGLKLSEEIMEYAPETRYCEVVFKNGSSYNYQGLYLMMESVKRDDSRVSIDPYKSIDKELGYILQYGHKEPDKITLNSYASREGFVESSSQNCYIHIVYPTNNMITPYAISKIEEEIEAFERVIYSKDPKVFQTFYEYIDVTSFYDYIIFNELLGNYDAKWHSFYIYKNKGDKLHLGPSWDFDGAMDNIEVPIDPESIGMIDGVWIKTLMRDKVFVEGLIKRYRVLRSTTLSDNYILAHVYETVELIGSAQQRDWNRWGKYYTELNIDDIMNGVKDVDESQTTEQSGYTGRIQTYEREINKIDETIFIHANWLDENTDEFYEFHNDEISQFEGNFTYKLMKFIFGSNTSEWLRSIYGMIYLTIIYISVVLIQREWQKTE
jgi:spore coat protein H